MKEMDAWYMKISANFRAVTERQALIEYARRENVLNRASESPRLCCAAQCCNAVCRPLSRCCGNISNQYLEEGASWRLVVMGK